MQIMMDSQGQSNGHELHEASVDGVTQIDRSKSDLHINEIAQGKESRPVTTDQEHHVQRSLVQDNEWTGWAELENDPAIFTTLVREWGIADVKVNEIYDLDLIFGRSPTETLGLIFLSRYIPPEESPPGSEIQTEANTAPYPWFANQISKFSCGTVALMNILMNAPDLTLSQTLSDFRTSTSTLTPKAAGIHLDGHIQLRTVHNSFATKLDRMIVDLHLKEEVQAAKQRSYKASKRKKGKSRKRKKSLGDDEEPGFHFVAYLSAHGAIWRLDGLESTPQLLGLLEDQQITWTQIAAQDIQKQMLNAQADGTEFSLLSVSQASPASTENTMAGAMGAQTHTNGTEVDGAEFDPDRMREDWAPFIETILRIHADRGDLNELLGL